MRGKIFLALLFTVGTVFIISQPTLGQPGGGKKGKGGPGGGMGMSMDPGAIFDSLARGRPSIPLTEIRWGKGAAQQFAEEKGITSGSLTRQQYIEFSDYLTTKMYSGAGKGPGGGPGGGGPGGKKKQFELGGDGGGGIVMQAPAPAMNANVINQLADESFKRYDKDGDGRLNAEEMPGRLKFQLTRWDKNSDGFIDLFEYREYFASQLGGGGGGDDGTRGIAAIVIEEEELDKKAVVFRVGGKMPPGLPDWFLKFDDDKDGQVALYEWRRHSKPLDEFREWDMNDDGFITPDEAVRQQAKLGKSSGGGTLASSADGSGAPTEQRFPFMMKGPQRGNDNGGSNPEKGGFDFKKGKKNKKDGSGG